jgi:hypothetical protein
MHEMAGRYDLARAIGFLLHLLINPGYSERHSNQHRFHAISSCLSSTAQTAVDIIERASAELPHDCSDNQRNDSARV